MRYLLVDSITEYRSETVIKGVKNITMSEDFLAFHFPEYPVMPGSLLLESLVQLAGWFEAGSSGFENWFLLGQVTKCNFYDFALPGDQVMLEVRPTPAESLSTPTYQGIGKVGRKKKIKAVFQGKRIPLDEIEAIDHARRNFQILSHNWKWIGNRPS